jgi:hypothetical protein
MSCIRHITSKVRAFEDQSTAYLGYCSFHYKCHFALRELGWITLHLPVVHHKVPNALMHGRPHAKLKVDARYGR